MVDKHSDCAGGTPVAQNYQLIVHVDLNMHNGCAFHPANAQKPFEIVRVIYFPESIL